MVSARLLVVLALCFAQVAVAFNPAPARLWWVNELLQRQTIGRFEPAGTNVDSTSPGAIGPCPSLGRACKIDFATLPESIKNIGLNLPSPVNAIQLRDMLPSGVLKVYRLEINDVEIRDTVITSLQQDGRTMRVGIKVVGFKANIKLNLAVDSISFPVVGSFSIGRIDASTNKAAQTAGTDLDFELFITSPPSTTLSTSFPNNMTMGNCSVILDLGLHVDNVVSVLPFQDTTTSVTNILVNALEPTLGQGVCGILRQTFYTFQGEPGFVNDRIITPLFETIANLSTKPDPVLLVEDQNLRAELTAAQLATAITFNDNTLVKGASKIVNEWIGGTGNPPVNEVVNLLTMPDNGTAVFSDLTAFGLSIPVHTPVAKVTVDVNKITLTGLNTFSELNVLNIASNMFYTLDNTVKMANVGVKLEAMVKMVMNTTSNTPKGWINRASRAPYGVDSSNFSLTLTLGLTNLNAAVALALAMDPHKLAEVQLGQLLGKQKSDWTAVQQLASAGACAGPAMYRVALPFLKLGLTNLITPVFQMTPEDVGIEDIVDKVTTAVLTTFKTVFTTKLPVISQHGVRPLVNDLLSDFFTGVEDDYSDNGCLEYTTLGSIFPNLTASTIFKTTKDLIHDVIGGDPVKNNAVSVNELVEQVVLFACEVLGSATTCSLDPVVPGKWSFVPNLSLFPSKSFDAPVPANFVSQITLTEVEAHGVNSIYRLLLDNIPAQSQGVNLKLAIGTASNPLEIIIKQSWKVNYLGPTPDVDEQWSLRIRIEQFTINTDIIPKFDLDQLYQLRLEDLGRSACILAPLVSLLVSANLQVTKLGLFVDHTAGTSAPGPNPLRSSLQALELLDKTTVLTTMFNYILSSVGSFIGDMASKLPDPTINAKNCIEEANAFDTFATRLLKSVFTANLTAVLQKATGAQPPVPSPAALDANVTQLLGSSAFDLQENFFIPLINKAVEGVSQPKFKEALLTIANSTSDDILSNSFKVETDDSISLDVNFTHYEMFKDGFDISSLITDARFFLYDLKLTNISATDMDTIMLLKPVSKFVLDTNIEIPARLNFQIRFGLSLPPTLKGNSPGPNLLTDFTFTAGLENLEIALQTLTALDQRRVNGLSLGNFVTVDGNQTFGLNPNGITCLLRLFLPNGLSIPKLMIGLSKLDQPKLTASSTVFVEPAVISFLNAAIQILADFYIKDLKDVTQGGLRVLLNTFLLEPNLLRPGFCQNPVPPPLTGSKRILNFQESETISFINSLTSSVLAGEDGRYALFNTLVSTALDNRRFFTSPENEVGFKNLNVVYKKAIFGSVSGAFRDLGFNGMGSFKKLSLLEPKAATTVANNISIGGPFDLIFGIKWSLKDIWADDDSADGVTDEIEMDLSMTNVVLGLTLNAAIDIPDLLLVQAGSFTNFSQIACVLTAVQNLSVSNFLFDVDKINTTLRCAGLCESPLFVNLAKGIPITSGDSNSFANFIPQIIEILVNLINSSGFNEETQTAVDNSESNCAAALNLTTAVAILNAEAHHGVNVAVIFALALLGIGAGCVLLAPLAVPRHYQLKDRMLSENLLRANSQPGANAQSVARFMAKQERDQVALAWHPGVSKCCKCFVPVMAIANVVLLALSFIVYLSFAVDARLTILGSATKLYTLVPWTISSTINDMWNSGAWPLSVLIVFASCAWPVVKNIALFAIWFAPKTFLSHERREHYLVLLDILGKWSFLDVYIINILVGVLRFSLNLSDAPILSVLPIPSTGIVIEVIVTPGTGIILLCVAAFMSLIVNHVIIWEMMKAEWADRRLFKQIDGEQDDVLTPKANIRLAISEYVFSTTTPSGQRDRYGPRAKNTVILLIGSAIVLLIVGYSVPYFRLTYDGLVGILLAFFIEGGRVRIFSLFTIGAALPAASSGSAYANALMLFFTVLYFVTVIIAPVVQMILHLFLWLKPLSLKDAHTVLFFAKVAAYWASMEVFAVGIIATTIEIQPVTFFLFDFITGGTCGALKGPLTSIDRLGQKDGNCLTPGAYLEWGFFVALIANLYQIAVGAIMIRASGVAIRDREDILERQPHREWTMLEYRVLDKLLVYGAAHHRPNPSDKPSMSAKLSVQCKSDPLGACAACGASLCGKLNIFAGCCQGVQDVSLAAPVTGKSGKVGNSKWNAPSQSAAASNRWNNPSAGAPASANPSWNMSASQAGVGSRAMVANDSLRLDSSNPVFAREQQSKRYSVDV